MAEKPNFYTVDEIADLWGLGTEVHHDFRFRGVGQDQGASAAPRPIRQARIGLDREAVC